MVMEWSDKFMAMKALAGNNTAIHARSESDWYVVVPSVEIGGNGILESPAVSGRTPQEAIELEWESLTKIKAGRFLVVNAMKSTRRHVRWNGYMWEDVQP